MKTFETTPSYSAPRNLKAVADRLWAMAVGDPTYASYDFRNAVNLAVYDTVEALTNTSEATLVLAAGQSLLMRGKHGHYQQQSATASRVPC